MHRILVVRSAAKVWTRADGAGRIQSLTSTARRPRVGGP
jgi:hypothetical protein